MYCRIKNIATAIELKIAFNALTPAHLYFDISSLAGYPQPTYALSVYDVAATGRLAEENRVYHDLDPDE